MSTMILSRRLGLVLVVACASACGSPVQDVPPQTVGQKVDSAVGKLKQGADRIASGLHEGFEAAKQKVQGLSLEARVYSRIHWDKSLADSEISLEVAEDGTVVLKGTLPSREVQEKAVNLAQDTVGVRRVVDRTILASPERSDTPAR